MTEATPTGADASCPSRPSICCATTVSLFGKAPTWLPHLVECADALTDCDDENAYYASGIDLFLAGVPALRPR